MCSPVPFVVGTQSLLGPEPELLRFEKRLAIPVPHIHHSDQGLQYAATDYANLFQQHGIQISMAGVGKPEETAMQSA